MELQLKIISGLERFSEVFKTLLWEKAKLYRISPIQIQILLFVSSHNKELSNVSSLAKEFNITKATVSDAVRVLLDKKLLEKDFSPIDNRRYNILLSEKGKECIDSLMEYSTPVLEELGHLNEAELKSFFSILSKLIFQLNRKGVIQIQRTCFGCKYYNGNRENSHYCNLLEEKLANHEIRLDCAEFEM